MVYLTDVVLIFQILRGRNGTACSIYRKSWQTKLEISSTESSKVFVNLIKRDLHNIYKYKQIKHINTVNIKIWKKKYLMKAKGINIMIVEIEILEEVMMVMNDSAKFG